MNNFKKSFKNKKFRYGAFSTFIALFMIAILVAVNLVVQQFDLKLDLTQTKFFSITDTTKEVLANLQEDITIYTLFPTGEEEKTFDEILGHYQSNSKHITVANKDPYINKTFVDQYNVDGTAVSNYSIIVQGAKRSKIIAAKDLVGYAQNPQTGDYYQSTLDVEPKVTNAIIYVTQESTLKAYVLEGHNEAAVPASYLSALSDTNYDYESINLLTAEIPEDCSVLIVTTPKSDWNKEEAQKVLSYLQGGGRAIFYVDIVSPLTPLTNLESVVNAYGVDFNDSLIFEGDSNQIFQINTQIFPLMTEHSILTSIKAKNHSTFITTACGIDTLDMKKSSITVEPLLVTSNKAYGKNTATIKSVNKEAGDANGPFTLAAAVTDTFYTANEAHITKLVLVGSTSMLKEENDELVYRTNSEFFVNSLNWLVDKTDADSVYVKPKSLQTATYLTLTVGQQKSSMAIAFGVIPGVIVVAGLVVWLRRRNK